MAIARNLLLTAVSLLSVGLISAVILGRRTVEETAEEIINALSQSTFDDWSPAFISTNDPVLGKTLPSTLFIPLSSNVHGRDPHKLAAYYIVPEHLAFADLISKKQRTLLPTLLPGFSILLTNSSRGLAVDGVDIVEPDVFVDSSMAIHRVASLLDFGKYGGGSVSCNLKCWALTITSLCVIVSFFTFYVIWKTTIDQNAPRTSPRTRRSPRI